MSQIKLQPLSYCMPTGFSTLRCTMHGPAACKGRPSTCGCCSKHALEMAQVIQRYFFNKCDCHESLKLINPYIDALCLFIVVDQPTLCPCRILIAKDKTPSLIGTL